MSLLKFSGKTVRRNYGKQAKSKTGLGYQTDKIKRNAERVRVRRVTLNAYMCVQAGKGVEKLDIRCVCTKWMTPYQKHHYVVVYR